MEIMTIQGRPRTAGGRHANERVRRGGLVPAVIYGHGEAPETIALSLHDLEIALENHNHVVNLKTDAGETRYLLKEVQYDHLQRTPIHVDLMRVDASERVHVAIPLEFRGVPKGVSEGGSLIQVISDLDIDCPLLAIPESIKVNVGELGMNQSVHVRELELPADVIALRDPNEIVCVVRPPRGEAEAAVAPVEGAATEPEVIKKGPKETEGEAPA